MGEEGGGGGAGCSGSAEDEGDKGLQEKKSTSPGISVWGGDPLSQASLASFQTEVLGFCVLCCCVCRCEGSDGA